MLPWGGTVQWSFCSVHCSSVRHVHLVYWSYLNSTTDLTLHTWSTPSYWRTGGSFWRIHCSHFFFYFFNQIYCTKGLLPMLHITDNWVKWRGNSLDKHQSSLVWEPLRAMQVLPPHPSKRVAWQTRISQPVSSMLPNTAAQRRKSVEWVGKAELVTKPI